MRHLFTILSARRKKVLAITAIAIATGYTFISYGQSSAPSIPAVQMATDPLYATTAIEKPAMALALSVEYPTVGAQYTPSGSTDNTYSNTTEYLGYYDAESCYTYNNTPTETVASGYSTADYKRFDRTGAATARKCTNAFSGNFLNWASSSAIDMLRLALSGGDRYIDTTDLTILQRAVIPNGTPVCMWNTTNFPAKQLTRNGDGTGTYWGAVPTAMITQANGNDIWVANTLNRIYFGTAQGGGCGNTNSYSLGSSSGMESPVRTGTALPSGTTRCINGETGTCSFSGIKEVWYGAGSKWYVAAASNGVDCSAGCNNVFGDPISGTAKTVWYRDYAGSWSPNTTSLNSDGFFYARVQVCNVSGTTLQDSRDYNLCRQYPSGKYKPTGVVQKYSDQLRLAAFGYLMDPTASYNSGGRYGGVLRAPMKFVGGKTYDEFGQDNTPSGGNANAEWNSTTGVFITNPDNYTNTDTSLNFGTSGVINYLNKFGRTGATQGLYKTYDPVGELHYEALRYLQGLQPTADAISNISTSMYDGYPVYTNWTDPYGGSRSRTSDYSCVKSNIVVIGDINTHDGNRMPTPNASNNIIDINYWRGIVQAFEKNQTSTTYADGNTPAVNRNVGNPNGANNSVPGDSSTSQIMGSAYWSHTHDIRGTGWTNNTAKQRPGLRVKTFLFDVNEYGAQNNSNTRRYANQFFMAAKYGGFETDKSNSGSKPYNLNGNPFKNSSGTNDNNVWQKSAEPGEASTYYLQSSARGVLNAFNEIFGRAATASRSIAGSSSSTGRVSVSAGSLNYSAKFDTSNWSGDVVAENITVDSSGNISIGSTAWSAADRLSVMASPATNRNVVIGVPGSTSNPTATPFKWNEISSTLRTQLSKETPTSTADTLGEARLNFLRGDRTKEGNPFRVRSSLLGDIVNSSVVYSGAPSLGYTGAGYSLFQASFKNRTKAVFVGANDGMLHAFNATTGDELFGYIPSWTAPRLSALASTSYVSSHQNYVDAPPAVGEAQVASTGAATDWKTVLVSGTGGGGSGIFALDVSNPADFSASKVMWEFTRADDSDMGMVIGQPQILKFRTNALTETTPAYRWFAVVASGANNYVPDSNGVFSSTGKPALFLIALDKAAGAAWALGTNYYKVSVPIDDTLKTTRATGMANFTPLWGAAGEVTQIYMGDFHGKLWKLDFVGKAAANWNMNNLTAYDKGTSGSPAPYPLYVAKDSSGNNQSITAAPTLFTGPIVAGLESFYVAFGTGKYLESSDNTSTAAQSFYTIYDNSSTVADSSSASRESIITGRDRLVQGTLNTTARTVTVAAFKWGRPTTAADTSKRSGWYLDFPTSGEKLISSITDRGNFIAAFNTIIPGSSGTAGSCSNTAGSGNSYNLNITSGNGTYVTSQVGMLGPDTYFINDSQTTYTAFDSTGRRIRTTVQKGVTIGQSGASTNLTDVSIKETIGRLSWREIRNYQDLKNK